MKKIMIASITAFSLSCSNYVLAGGPDMLSTSGLDNHWSVSILGGTAINIASSKSFYRNLSNGNASQSFDTTAYDVSGIVGAELRYLWSLSHNNQIGVSANFNYDINTNIEEIWHIESTIATSDPMDLTNTVSPKYQYNLLVNFIHDLGNSFSIGVNAGFSLLQANTTLTVTDVGNTTAGKQAESGNNAYTAYFPGGVLGIQASLLVTKNSSVDFNINDYIYSGKNLPNITSIDTTANDSLTGRKTYISIPSLLVKYSYHF